MSDTAAIPASPAPKGKKNLLVIGLSAVIVLGGLGGGAFWWTQRAQAAEAEPDTKPVETREHGLVAFEPFVANLADADRSRFVRAKISLVVGDVEEAEAIAKSPVKLMQARAAILELLTTQTSDVLVTPEGKAALRQIIAERIHTLVAIEVVDVLFSDFVVQF